MSVELQFHPYFGNVIMFTPTFFRIFSSFITICSKFYVIPFTWDGKREKLVFQKKSSHLLFYRIHLTHMILCGIYLCFQFLNQMMTKSLQSNYMHKMLLFMFIVGYTTGSIQGINLYLKRRQISFMIFQLSQIYTRLVRKIVKIFISNRKKKLNF